jgi:GTP-binding protein
MSHWLVAVVGRPNVGKSTLFNRIVGARNAIVHDVPGVTRDRHYADSEWAGKKFTIIDTGGFVPESKDEMEVAVREQTKIAIEEADCILFIVDGASGILAGDTDLAGVLRRGEKKVLVVANKIDSEKHIPRAAEFYALGLGDPVPVSALMGLRIGDLLDKITEDIPVTPPGPEDARLKIAILGRPNVGKSSLVNALLGKKRSIVASAPGTTRDPIDSVLKYMGEQVILIDTAGLRRRSRINESVEFFSTVRTIRSLERCDVAVILLDAMEGPQHQDLRIIELAMERRRATVLVVNKWDLLEKESRTAAILEGLLKKELRAYDFLPVVFISSLTRQRVFRVLELAKKVDEEQHKRVGTSRLNTLLGKDIKAYPPRSKSGKEIRINYVTQVNTKPPVFAFFCNEPKLVGSQYRRYLSNCLRKHFAFAGVPIVVTMKKK